MVWAVLETNEEVGVYNMPIEFFHEKEHAEAYASYRTWRDVYEHNQYSYLAPSTYSTTEFPVYEATKPAIEFYEYVHGEPVSGEEYVKQREAHRKKYTLVAVTEEDWKAFQTWKQMEQD